MNTSTKIATINGLATNSNQCGFVKLNIHTATGGHFEINMPEKESVSTLKWRLARKLKISGEKISLLFKNRPLKEGSLQDNFVTDNSKILLLPNMESGMTFQRPEVGVIQGLENLTESQVNDFLSGRAPLLLVIKLGDHMMFVQLQLSTASCGQSTQTNRSQCTVDGKEKVASGGPMLNSAALAELGHNLSQKLREFSQLSTHQKVSEHCISGSPVPSHSNPPSSTSSTYSVTKNGTVNGQASHTQPPTSAIINNNNNNNNNSTNSNSNNNTNSTNSSNSNSNNNSNSNINSNNNNNNNSNNNSTNNSSHSHNPNNTSLTPSTPCNPSIPCATTTAGPAPVSRNCPTTGEPLQGAIIESMHHIGQGVYSGTFSGTLDPSLQDMDGKPKRNIGTIIHILNDLLGATPQYRAPGTSHTLEKIPVDSCTHKTSEQPAQLVSLSEQDTALRGKIKDLQMKMEEKRMRRQARRDAKAPYQCHGPRSNNFFNLPISTTTTTDFALSTDTDCNNLEDICSAETNLPAFVAPQLPECTVTEMDIGDDSIADGEGEGENREIEMTAMPTQATATATGSSTTGSTKPTEPSAYANPSLEQESVLV